MGQGKAQKQPKSGELEDGEMDVDAFLEKGFFEAMDASDDEGSEGEEESSEEEEGEKKGTKKRREEEPQDIEDEMAQHKRDLEELRKDKKQASFLQYLEKESPGLLEDLGDSEEEEEDGEKQKHPELTMAMLEMWKKSFLGEKSVPAMKRLVQAFRMVSHMNDNVEGRGDAPDESSSDHRFSYRISDPSVFNEIIVLMVSQFSRGLQSILGKTLKPSDDDSEEEEGGDGKSSSPNKKRTQGFNAARFPKFAKVKDVVRSYFANLHHFVGQLSEPKMLNFVLQHLEGLLKYLSPFGLLQKRFLKVLLGMWSSATAESVRILAFFCLRRMALELPYPFIDHVLKGVYLTYVRNCKFVNRTTVALVNFLSNCVVEIYGIDFVSSYQHAFVYIRELASHLRNSYTSKKKAARKSIYNFQYVNSINAWVQILAAYPQQEALSLLHYPLVQLIQGTIAYQPTNRYFPLRLRCVTMLNALARSSRLYINASSYLLEILSSSDMYKRPKPSMEKSLDLKTNLKVSKTAIASKIYQDSIFDETFDRLVEYLALFSKSIAFPELVFPIINALNKFKNATHNISHSKRVKTLLERIHASVKLIQSKRNSVSFSAKDIAAVSNFLGDQETPLTKLWDDVHASIIAAAASLASSSSKDPSQSKSSSKKHSSNQKNDSQMDAEEELSSEDSQDDDDDNSDASELEILGSDDDMLQEVDEDMMSEEEDEDEE